ncbi:hypothetical protein LSTR_LSTR001114 [Laodelphax striatellus]|uniref:Platelet-derived growth factor (PDGF) family profile domain-containing protein n=1 Tax=Laodelphax striatellus TaxID=195883 RepID=A0A482X1G8_LAOST|nr:hypothetical protein LSTR_LSTR001114 [Laodelphax striatellus]
MAAYKKHDSWSRRPVSQLVSEGKVVRLVVSRIMRWLCVVCALACLATSMQGARRRFISHKQNFNQSAEFRCHRPDRRAISVRDIHQIPKQNRIVIPPYVVLQRCDSQSGCCPDPACCAPKHKRRLTVEFEFAQRQPQGRTEHGWQNVTLEEHIECACIPCQYLRHIT